MKKSKKLMILGLSAATACVAATSAVSSFAWFATNDTVTATGMKVKIQSAATLLIDTAADTDTTTGMLKNGASTKAALSESKTTASLSPVSTVNGTAWFSAKASEATSATAKDGTYENVTDSADNYRLVNTFYLQSFDGSKKTGATYDTISPAKKIVVDSVTVDYKTGDNLNASFRVLVTCGSSAVFVAPTSSVKPTNPVGVSSISSGSATTSAITYADATVSGKKASLASNNTVVTGVNYNEVYTVNVYLYFDGEDASCKSENIPTAENLSDYTVTVSFNIKDSGNA